MANLTADSPPRLTFVPGGGAGYELYLEENGGDFHIGVDFGVGSFPVIVLPNTPGLYEFRHPNCTTYVDPADPANITNSLGPCSITLEDGAVAFEGGTVSAPMGVATFASGQPLGWAHVGDGSGNHYITSSPHVVDLGTAGTVVDVKLMLQRTSDGSWVSVPFDDSNGSMGLTTYYYFERGADDEVTIHFDNAVYDHFRLVFWFEA